MKLYANTFVGFIGIFLLGTALLIGGCATGRTDAGTTMENGTAQPIQDLQSRLDEAETKADQAMTAAEEARARAEECCSEMEQVVRDARQAADEAQNAARQAQDAAKKSEAIFNKMMQK